MLPVTTAPHPGPATPAGPITDDTATQRMLATVHRLAAPDLTGRRTGTPGGRASAAWLADQLRADGATVTLDRLTVVGAVKELYATPVAVYADHTGTTHALVHRRDFCEHLATADLPTPATGKVTTATDDDIRGAWVTAEGYDPEAAAHLAGRGAAGMLVPRGTDSDGWMPKMIAGPPAGALPVLALHTDWHQRLDTTFGTTLTASVPLRTVDVQAVNVYATFRPALPGRANVLLTAHYDGVGDDPHQPMPAAADNASGVAAILEAARQLAHSDLDIGLAVALLDAEEAGAHGSGRHATGLTPGTLVINLDGAAALHEACAVEAGGDADRLLAALDRAGRITGVALRGQAMPSDNRRYAAAGHAAVGIGMGIPGYQTPAETPDRVEPATLAAAARLVIAAVEHLATTEAAKR